MTNRLIIKFPSSTITFETEDSEKLIALSDFCKTNLDAYHSTENIDELTVDELNEEQSNNFHSLLFELGLL